MKPSSYTRFCLHLLPLSPSHHHSVWTFSLPYEFATRRYVNRPLSLPTSLDSWLGCILEWNPSSPRRQLAPFTPERLPNQPSDWIRKSAGQPLAIHSLNSTPSTDIDKPQRPHSIDSWLTSIPDTSTNTMFQFPEKYTIPSTPRDRPSSRVSLSRMGSWALTPRKLALIAASCFGILILKFVLSLSDQPGVCLGS